MRAIVCWVFDCPSLSDLLTPHLSFCFFLHLVVADRDHIYTVDTETANGDEIFFSKVSKTSGSLRVCDSTA